MTSGASASGAATSGASAAPSRGAGASALSHEQSSAKAISGARVRAGARGKAHRPGAPRIRFLTGRAPVIDTQRRV